MSIRLRTRSKSTSGAPTTSSAVVVPRPSDRVVPSNSTVPGKQRAMLRLDAFGLGLFAISGASLAMVAGMPALVSVLLGAVTAVSGGVLRDVLCNEIPRVFHDHRPYTLCAFVGCAIFLGLDGLGAAPELSTTAGVASTTGLRLLAVWTGWRIPAWPRQEKGGD